MASTLGSNSLIKQNGLLDFGHLDVLLNFTFPWLMNCGGDVGAEETNNNLCVIIYIVILLLVLFENTKKSKSPKSKSPKPPFSIYLQN